MKRLWLLLVSLAVVAGLGGVAAWTQLTTARQVTKVHDADRRELQATLSGLTGQYLNFTFLAAHTAAEQTDWSLRANDPGDVARLHRVVAASPLTTYGAALLSPLGQPLTTWSGGKPIPPQTDWGYDALRAELLAGRPGLSSVMRAGNASVVAFAVPVTRSGQVAGLFVSYADVKAWPLQGYNQGLSVGAKAQAYVVDTKGIVAAAADPAVVGKRAPSLIPLANLRGAGSRTVMVGTRPAIASYGHTPQGWLVATVQDEAAYSGALREGHQREVVALVVLLTLVVALLVLFHSKRQQALGRLADERLYDPLTGLAQRRLFEFRLEAALARQRRSGRPLALLYCDCDGFKGVNDRYGHNIGDLLLTVIAQRLLAGVREDDLVVRLGGDEFAVLVEATSPLEVRGLVARLRDAVEQPAELSSVVLTPRLSIGGAVLIDPDRAEHLLHEADLAMYQAKSARKQGDLSDRRLVTELTVQDLRLPPRRYADLDTPSDLTSADVIGS